MFVGCNVIQNNNTSAFLTGQRLGYLTALKDYCLPLLPSGPDGVHMSLSRETQP